LAAGKENNNAVVVDFCVLFFEGDTASMEQITFDSKETGRKLSSLVTPNMMDVLSSLVAKEGARRDLFDFIM
jgi:hypothetical protein